MVWYSHGWGGMVCVVGTMVWYGVCGRNSIVLCGRWSGRWVGRRGCSGKTRTPLRMWGKIATVSGMEGGSFSKFGSRRSAAHIRLKNLQQVQGWRAVPFQNWALALAPRTFVLKVCKRYRDGGRLLFKMRLWGACFSRARVQV